MKKLLVVSDLINGSGVTEFVFNVFGNFDPNEYLITVIGYGDIRVAETNNRAINMGWKVYRAPAVTKNAIKHWKFWKDFLKENHFDIAYFNYSSSWNFFPIVYAKKSGITTVVCHSHNSYFSHQFSNKILNSSLSLLNKIGRAFINRYSDIRIATSSDASKWMFGKYPAHIIKNGIVLKKYLFSSYMREKLRSSIGIKNDEYVIGFVGVLTERKNPIFAIYVFERFLRKHPHSYLVIAGSGKMLNEIEKVASLLGIAKNVRLLGYSPDINYWYSAFDALVFPSLFEGFPLVALEAQVSNLPIIISKNVTRKVLVNSNTKQLTLENGTLPWARELDNLINVSKDRNMFNDKLIKFDSKEQARKIIKLITPHVN